MNCDLWSRDMNSTLGSVVPLAKFLFNSLNCLLQRDVLWKRRNPTSCLVLTGGQPVVTVCVFTTDIRLSCFCFAQTLDCRKNIVLNNSSSNAGEQNGVLFFYCQDCVYRFFWNSPNRTISFDKLLSEQSNDGGRLDPDTGLFTAVKIFKTKQKKTTNSPQNTEIDK